MILPYKPWTDGSRIQSLLWVVHDQWRVHQSLSLRRSGSSALARTGSSYRSCYMDADLYSSSVLLTIVHFSSLIFWRDPHAIHSASMYLRYVLLSWFGLVWPLSTKELIFGRIANEGFSSRLKWSEVCQIVVHFLPDTGKSLPKLFSITCFKR